jgi:hypothetical protein
LACLTHGHFDKCCCPCKHVCTHVLMGVGAWW